MSTWPYGTWEEKPKDHIPSWQLSSMQQKGRTRWKEEVSLCISLFCSQKYPFFPPPIILKFHKCTFDSSDFCTLSGTLVSSPPPSYVCTKALLFSSLFLLLIQTVPRFLFISLPQSQTLHVQNRSPLSLMKYQSGGLQLALQIFEEDVWLSRQFRPKKDIDHRETSSNHTQKNLVCVKTKLR